MRNCHVHPVFSNIIHAFGAMPPAGAPVLKLAAKPAPQLRAYTVSIYIGQDTPHELNVMAFTTCDAITRAIDIFFDGEEPMPADGMEVVARPFANLPRAA